MSPGLQALNIWEVVSWLHLKTGIILVDPNSPLKYCGKTRGFQLHQLIVGKLYYISVYNECVALTSESEYQQCISEHFSTGESQSYLYTPFSHYYYGSKHRSPYLAIPEVKPATK